MQDDVTATEQPDLGGSTAESPGAEEIPATPDPEAEASAGTENTVHQAERSQSIPRQRFDQVNAKRKEAEAKAEALQAELDKLRAPKEPEKPLTPEDLPPEYHRLDDLGKLKYLAAKFSREDFERETGLTYEDVKVFAAASKQAGTYTAEQRWRELCDQNGLDPANKDVQEMFVAYTQGAKKTHDEAIALTAKFYGKPKPAARNGARVEEAVSVTPTFGGNPIEAKTAREAAELAQKGLKVPFRSSTDIIAAALKANKEPRP